MRTINKVKEWMTEIADEVFDWFMYLISIKEDYHYQ